MFGAVLKTYYAEKMGIDPKKIVSVSIMPCTAKKFEIGRADQSAAGVPDVDYALTTRELARMIKRLGIRFTSLPDEGFDDPLGESTGAGVIFGATGGVMEAALRTAYYAITGTEAPADAFVDVRGEKGRKVREFTIAGKTLRTCTVSGLANAGRLIEDLQAGKVHYDFVEVMACPGGCVGGGGQPIHDGQERAGMLGKKLYKLDDERKLRQSHNNPDVVTLYSEYLEKPLSERAEKLLHSNHVKEKNYLV